MSESTIKLDGGKYTVIHNNGTNFHALRHGEKWRDLTGDGLVLSMAQRIEELESIVEEVNSWIVCSAITTPDDMMQNAARIAQITAPDYGHDL